MLENVDVLDELSFGQRVAEEETADLIRYFVRTEQWRRLISGEVDIVYGHKGAGKSALYAALLSKSDELQQKRILLIAGEDPRERPPFKGLLEDPPSSEHEFSLLWKIYFLQLIGETFRRHRFETTEARTLVTNLEKAGLLPREDGLASKLRSALAYIKKFLNIESLSTTIEVDSASGLPSGLTSKVSFRETREGTPSMLVTLDAAFRDAETVLQTHGFTVWILMDRLDVAFLESEDLERIGLRALFSVYADLRVSNLIKLKIFLRSDIWERITEQGFREASHITRDIRITWEPRTLMNLIIRRIVQSATLLDTWGLSAERVLSDIEEQKQLFYRIFPVTVSYAPEALPTFDWMLSRTADGTTRVAPRELIHLLTEARSHQMGVYEVGGKCLEADALISAESLQRALIDVSNVRLHQTLFAEYPNYRPYINKLKGTPAQYSVAELAEYWAVPPSWATARADELVEIGFFARKGSRHEPVYWVPYLYRPALNLQDLEDDTN